MNVFYGRKIAHAWVAEMEHCWVARRPRLFTFPGIAVATLPPALQRTTALGPPHAAPPGPPSPPPGKGLFLAGGVGRAKRRAVGQTAGMAAQALDRGGGAVDEEIGALFARRLARQGAIAGEIVENQCGKL